jgi:chromosome segregation ATPase
VAKTITKGGGATDAQRIGRQVTRLERRLGRLTAQEARRSRKLSRTQDRVRAVEERLRELRGAGTSAGAQATAGARVAAYCLRERRRVEMTDAAPMTLRNGRSALAGTCPSCGARIVSMAAAQA